MGQADELSSRKPPRLLERLVGWAVPSANREYVLGDLHERYSSPLGYLADAVSAVPAAIVGSLRRSTPTSCLLLEFILIYISVLLAAVWSSGYGPIWGGGPPSLSKSAAAAAYLALVLMGRDAYRRRPLSQPLDKSEMFLPPTRIGGIELPNTPGYYLREKWPEGHRRISMISEVFMIAYFAFGVYYGIQAVWPTLNIFPGIMTTLHSTWILTLLLAPLRIWMGAKKTGPKRRA